MSLRLLLALLWSAALPGVALQITVAPVSDPPFALTVQPGDRVAEVKQQIHALKGVLPERQQLFFAGRQLEDPATLAHYGVTEGATLRLTGRFTEDAAVDAAGGGLSTAGADALMDTAGQPAIGVSSSASYTLTHGFWRATAGDPLASPMNCAQGKNVECGVSWAFDPPSVGPSPGGQVMVLVLSTVTNLGCGLTLTATRAWRAIDGWGDTYHCSQTVRVVDTTPPTLTCAPARTVECGAAWTFEGPVGFEVCGSVFVTVVGTVTNPGCGGTYTATRTWRATDACGNTSRCSQTVTVGDPARPPSLGCAPGKTLECGAPWTFDTPAASDPCGGVTVTVVSTVTNGNCGGAYAATRTWQAANACGQSAQCSQTVTLRDTTAPALSCAPPRTVECGATWTFEPPAVSDACGAVTLSAMETVTNAGCGNTLEATRTWRAADACGNTSECAQRVTVRDTTAPALACGANQTIECGAAWEFDQPAADDACGAVSLSVASTTTNFGCGGTLTATRTWRATDSCGNTTQCAQTVAVRDLTAPTIACAPAKTVECGAAWTFDPPAASDTCGGTSVALLGTVTNAGCGGTFTATRTWRVSDACGNTAECSQTVVVRDTTPPTLVCAPAKSVECGTAWTFDPPGGQETCGGISVNLLGTVTNAGCGGAFTATRTWLAADSCGNTAQCSQTVTVVDATPPALACAPDKSVAAGVAWNFDEPAVTDRCDPAPTLTIVSTVTNTLPDGRLTATRTWRATDACGNQDSCAQTVTLPAPLGRVRGLAQLEEFTGAGTWPDPHTRRFTFVATTNHAGSATVLKVWTLALANAAGNTFAFELPDAPLEANGLSVKTDWNKRRKLPLTFGPDREAVVNFTGADRLEAGDATRDNLVNLGDYSLLVSFWMGIVALSPDAAVVDFTGDGFINVLDYALLAANWFTAGDPE